ncbi:MAG: 2-C-methyl-D-erythritol 4-phosphate cytidylyltransferase [Clostridioides sp.]|jgi:2-C-methyl-D-erythritol 4-phosphate cytidylyltransferase|nr:2-C-methyl-D-erythritol 4-phosphate cytidylyltransferase [Clostridioides sp.]
MNSVIIVSAGSGKRMNLGMNKQFIKLKEKEIVAHTISKFYENKNIEEIILCIKEEEELQVREILTKFGFEDVIIAYGGAERQDSINSGLKKVSDESDIILIHDGARPFVDDDIIERSIRECKEHLAVVVGVPVSDTIKIVNEGVIEDTPDRSLLWSAQTPQVFDSSLLKQAYKSAYEDGFYGTDDSMLVERTGVKVHMSLGSYDNIKITNIEDLTTAEKIAEKQGL